MHMDIVLCNTRGVFLNRRPVFLNHLNIIKLSQYSAARFSAIDQMIILRLVQLPANNSLSRTDLKIKKNRDRFNIHKLQKSKDDIFNITLRKESRRIN